MKHLHKLINEWYSLIKFNQHNRSDLDLIHRRKPGECVCVPYILLRIIRYAFIRHVLHLRLICPRHASFGEGDRSSDVDSQGDPTEERESFLY